MKKSRVSKLHHLSVEEKAARRRQQKLESVRKAREGAKEKLVVAEEGKIHKAHNEGFLLGYVYASCVWFLYMKDILFFLWGALLWAHRPKPKVGLEELGYNTGEVMTALTGSVFKAEYQQSIYPSLCDAGSLSFEEMAGKEESFTATRHGTDKKAIELQGCVENEIAQHGYCIIPPSPFMKSIAETIYCLILSAADLVKRKSHGIFQNGPGANKAGDGKRHQMNGTSLPAKSQLARLYKLLGRLVSYTLLPADLIVGGVSILTSYPGCAVQHAHRDYYLDVMRSIGVAPQSVPVGVIVSLHGDTRIWIWPGSHRQCGPFDRSMAIEVSLPAGAILLFHGALVHGGSAYTSTNYRLHFYTSHVSPVNIQAPADSTQYAEMIGCVCEHCKPTVEEATDRRTRGIMRP
jgi:hypothetical protein